MEETTQILPSLDEDPKERKRILGVLAQRRYRQRKKQRRNESTTSEASRISGARSNSTPIDTPASSSAQWHGADVQKASDDTDFALSEAASHIPWTGFPTTFEDSFETHESTGVSNWSWTLEDQSFPRVNITPAFDPDSEQERATELFSHEATDFSDSAHLSLPCLDLVKAHVGILSTILTVLSIPYPKTDTIWNPFAVSPFHASPGMDFPIDEKMLALPPDYRPTATQLKVSHHPVFDLLPWPSVRDKLLAVMALPVPFRPPRAKDETENVVMQLKFDMFDPSGGTKIHGTNPMNGDSWEIGQVFFENWWWALDRSIISRSNDFRRARGESDLRLKRQTCI